MIEYDDQDVFQGNHAWFWRWRRSNGEPGGFAIHRIASVKDRGGLIRIVGYGRPIDKGPRLDVFCSDAGQSFQVYLNGKRMREE